MRPDKRFRLAVGTFRQDTRNSVRIIQREWVGGRGTGGACFVKWGEGGGGAHGVCLVRIIQRERVVLFCQRGREQMVWAVTLHVYYQEALLRTHLVRQWLAVVAGQMHTCTLCFIICAGFE